MKQNKHDNELYYRLVTLWIVCEAFAGGVMHAARIPFTGMIVSSLAVTCIILIAYYGPAQMSILKATVIVAIFKMMLSPHSPPTSYIAVFFQGYVGYLLFYNKRYFKISAILLSVIALTESAIQRILVLLILYGNSFWKAIDIYLQKLFGGIGRDYSLILASAYILIHAIVGFFLGIFVVKLVKFSHVWREENPSFIINEKLPYVQTSYKRKKKIKWLFIFFWLVLAILFIHASADPVNSVLPAGNVLRIVLRSLLIVLTWYFLVAPFFMQLLKKILKRQQNKLKMNVDEIMQMIPQTKYIFTQSWVLSAKESGVKRFKFFLKIVVINILNKKKE